MAEYVPSDQDRREALSNHERQRTRDIANGDRVTYKGEVHPVIAIQTLQGKISLRLANVTEDWVQLNEVQRVSDAA